MSMEKHYYPDQYEKTIDWTCRDCDGEHEDSEVLVSNGVALVTCACGYENEIDIDDE